MARSFRVNEIPNGSVNACANCHVDPNGGGPRNDFGTEIENNFLDEPGASGHVQWGPELAALDSDGDGFTNGEELQDPNGEWRPGDPQPGNPDWVTLPGDANDFPSPAIIVSSPNGGESYEPSQQIEIIWQSNLVTTVSIEHSSDNGNSWSEISASTESDGSFDWTIPNISSSENLIRINDTDSDASDQSNSTFEISDPLDPQLTLTSPNGGENWEAGSQQTITWTSSDVSNVALSFSTDGGNFWTEITSSTSSDGSFKWTIPDDIDSDQCKVRIQDNASSEEDESDDTFSIFVPLDPQITVTAPNGGEELEMGNQFEITWSSNDVSNVMIDFSSDNGTSWIEVTASTESEGSFDWTVPSVSSEECKIRISDVESETSDESDNTFKIFDPTSVEDELNIDFALSQNYPNPFNPSTTIRYQVAKTGEVELKIYNLAGKVIRTVVNQTISPGKHHATWDGKNELGNEVSSGIYIYRLKSQDFVESKQMILLK